jgi:hypothetical protein
MGKLAFMNRRSTWITVGLMATALGLAGCAATSPSATSPSASAPAGHGLPAGEGGSGSNARSGAAEGGTAGTVDADSTTGFTMTTSAGQQVTVTAAASTTYRSGSATASATDVAPGDDVLVLGMTTGTTITATEVDLNPVDAPMPTTYTASEAAPFTQGAPSAAKDDGQIPSDYTEGDGTIVSGTAADSATIAALSAYPGGVVDRVVQLAGGEYEVHYIGVNWPHHIFVDTDFTVVGAN